MNNIPTYHTYEGETNIALLDNSAISFMNQLSYEGFNPEVVLNGYDVILIPEWIMEEVKDAQHRMEYIEGLIDKGFNIKVVPEIAYSDLIDEKEMDLYRIVEASVSKIAALTSYLRRYVTKSDLLDLEPYEEWIQQLYDNWPIEGGTTIEGRKRRKNAGEISITILSEILSWNYPQIKTITIYSQDGDSYEFQKAAENKLKKFFFDRTPISVSFKSNDVILWQLYKLNLLDEVDIKNIRTNERFVTYTLVRKDDSTILESRIKDCEEFLELIKDDSVQIIF